MVLHTVEAGVHLTSSSCIADCSTPNTCKEHCLCPPIAEKSLEMCSSSTTPKFSLSVIAGDEDEDRNKIESV